MAMRISFSEEEILCPLCRHIYVDPVILTCSHNFCKVCLVKSWKNKKSLKCPLCKKQSSKSLPPPNLYLKMVCDRLHLDKNESDVSETLCNLHKENFKLFCMDDKQLVCMVCKESKTHSNHNFRPLDEAAQEHREVIKSKLKPLQDMLDAFLKAKQTSDLNLQHMKNQAQHTEQQIRSEFEKLHTFLEHEEAKQMSALRTEEKEKQLKLKETSDLITNEIVQLSASIKCILKKVAAEDTSFLKNYKATLEKTAYELNDIENEPALIDVAKHLGNLQFRVWEKMKDVVEYYPVILNPNTAHPRLDLSDSLTEFLCQDQHKQLPENPERVEHYLWVLGAEGLNSGTHSWDVDVKNSMQWALGVMTGVVDARGFYYAGVWKSLYQNATYGASASEGSTIIIRLKKDLQRIRVELDWDHGHISFSDPITGHNLKRFWYSFTDTVYPYFSNQCVLHPLTIQPQETFVSMEQSSSKYRHACYSIDSSV